MNHFTSSDFWDCYRKLPQNIQELADTNFSLLKENPSYPSLHLKKTGKFRSVRIGMHYRALGVELPEGLLWFWIGSHADYDKIIE
ncbi:MAG: hypothetical protein JW925_03495 [Syntrophaceae bacterium]|nr:hypothetical protein [Syntrophaceae bacterium]